MQRAYARGLTQSEARGHRARRGLSESQLRRQRQEMLNPGVTPWQQFLMTFRQRYGFEYRYWRYLKRNWVDSINKLSSPDMQITPVWIAQELANAPLNGHDREWIETRLAEKLYAMLEYRSGNSDPGALFFRSRDGLAPIEWWYYH